MIAVYLVVLVICVVVLFMLRPSPKPASALEQGVRLRRTKRKHREGDMLAMDDVIVIGRGGRVATDGDVDALEARLGTKTPAGYRELVTRWGAGSYGYHFHVTLPTDVTGESGPKRYAGTRTEMGRSAEGWPWRAVIAPERAGDVVVLARTPGGDEVGFLRGEPQRWLVLSNARSGTECAALETSAPAVFVAAAALFQLPELPAIFLRDLPRTKRTFEAAEPVPTEDAVVEVLRELGDHDAALRDWNDPFLYVFSARLGGIVTVSAASPEWGVDYSDAGVELELEANADAGELVRRLESLGFTERGSR